MRICLLCYRGNPYSGGQGIYIYYLSRELHRLGHEVHVMAGPPYPEVVEGVKLHKLESLNLYDRNFRPPSFSSILTPLNFYEFAAVRLGMFPEPLTFSIRAYRRLRGLPPHHRFDIVHDNQCLGYGLLLMRRLKMPIVATIHHPIPVDRDLELAYTESRWERFKLRRWYSFCAMQRRVSQRMDRVIAVSQSSAEDTKRLLGVPQSKIRVVYNGIDSNLFRRDDSVLKEPNSLIVVSSSEGPTKGVPYLLKALQLLRGETEVRLTIVGRNHGHYAKLAKEYGLEDRVTFTGRITTEELVRHYSAAEVAVVPSLYEGFGFPAAEAMSCQLPLIATRAGALPEVAGEDGEAAILVPPAAPVALAAAIQRLLSDEPLRRKMAEAGRKRMLKNFTWKQAAQRSVEVYRELL